MKHPDEYKGREVVVLGLAKSGVQVAKVLHERGAVVTVNDKKEREQSPEASELESLGISVICGGHPEGLIHEGVSLVVKNPGIPYSVPPVQKALELGIEIVTEVEVAYHICAAPMIGITGSNGKTTTTTWVGKMLDAAGMNPIVAGNIGTPLCQAAQEARDDNWMVVELSSFQLKGTETFRPKVGALLNLAETHLDYHGGMEDYVASKAKLFANQKPEDTAVLNWDDPVCRELVPYIKAGILPFSMTEELVQGIFVRPSYLPDTEDDLERVIIYRDYSESETEIAKVSSIGLPGRFNVENALAACGIAIAAGADPAVLGGVLASFRGVEHRLEYVAEKAGTAYYNNSKATNSKATTMALGSFKQPLVLIAGGLDRGSDYMELLPVLGGLKGIVVLGETRDKLAKVAAMAGVKHIISVDNGESAAAVLQQAVREASALAEPGEVVLLSPACASWDMFTSYEERGRIFKEAVHNL
ncbi:MULTISPECIES: UDP-N-acetylmuramoyl-L-alanine--D-glutamate ligase [unclassified Paenibacillus]|uniref:UDP-N-acetylmuramoyl-L-alanine--D-glutamate ligase n=1 Tax=unclassified Paenibacillus TaxID=185978 RepID=UPI0024050519|nr:MULTISPECIES: UDP-N-acetylmuramoyl-L-alanine--D-glutamate ligase [unclassified Paenibacillus]MDF9843215.1 UDP-N-acetylmuramoylalanine--D-glutamate ligase [Paenibacillus sp. PastF-2]MDF9849803.1 UDP-N-acetylmuramoylalanine--D-glutamate ligase [Paenibacillus sp. PastM-2]MDF9856510.1 UDP-N-acetylmuramoylalanine--D-glutamate ligase [Paenibacillus sp. PastF-1]MDH6481780.1 UDP-N-acetylmuramoylalanine--D-glutamate ligase [Paenibacillus sp. PastH-2]MDH6509130.1 UDP-N-acetylmuramoylalanine--D-glutam